MSGGGELSAETDALAPGDPDMRMDAYYYGFDATGVGVIDRILNVLACAGKAYHHTDSWQDEMDRDYGPIRKGETCAEAIQRVADESAATLRAVIRPGRPS